MPSCSKAKNPRGIEITFEEESHKYTSIINGFEVQYISGTQFLGKYYPKFDPDGSIIKRCALKEGVSVADLQAKWDAKGKESCRLGTRLHETIEDTLLKRAYRNTPENDEEKRRFDNGIKVGQRLLEKVSILGVEQIVFSDRLLLAGTIDLLAKTRDKDTYLIIDHKTNKTIEKENKYNKFCLAPIEHIPDLSYWHYALQLNLYQYLLKYESYVPKNAKFRMFLNHVTSDAAAFIELPDMQSDIKDLVIEHLVQKSLENSQTIAHPTSKEELPIDKVIDSF